TISRPLMLAAQTDPVSPAPLHEVITFYSYKGGTGRTMALANIACLFAREGTAGLRVLAIDWDLEAPGLHYYLRAPNGGTAGQNSAGVVEYFSRALELVENAALDNNDADVYAERILEQISVQGLLSSNRRGKPRLDAGRPCRFDLSGSARQG
ncbi:MAG: hypothetical protein ACREV2_14180, partial [Burkholderiales bacterium]